MACACVRQRVFAVCFHVTLCLMLVDWACPIPWSVGLFGVYEAAFALACVSFAVCLIKEKGRFFGQLWRLFKTSRLLCGAVGAYTLFGAVTVLYGADPAFGGLRYRVVAQMLGFGLMALYYLFMRPAAGAARLRHLGWNMGLTAGGIALVALVGYATNLYTVYYQRISTIRDYNQYATILLVGLVCFTFAVVGDLHRPLARWAALLPFWTVTATAVYQAGSRRSDVLLLCLGAVCLLYVLWDEVTRHRRRPNGRRLAAGVCLLAVCVGLCVGAAALTHQWVGQTGPARLAADKAELQRDPALTNDETLRQRLALAGRQDELSAAVEGMLDGSGFARRRLIWQVAWDAICRSTPTEWLFGHGASYSWELYDDLSNPLVAHLRSLYPKALQHDQWLNPHQLFLQDMLEGGLVLLALDLLVLAAVAMALFTLLRRAPRSAVALGLCAVVLLATLMISSAKGMVAHKFFWLLITALVAERFRVREEKESAA